MKPLGFVLYEGPSRLTGEPIVCILTGTRRPSSNPKTGPMLQTWILRTDRPPIDAAKDGTDEAICGGCPLRGAGDGTMHGRRCYVNVAQGPGSVWKAWKAGKYTPFHFYMHADHIQGKAIRFGSYGDPAAVPTELWKGLASWASSWTGYTHQWRHPAFDAALLDYCMASVESLESLRSLQHRFPNARYFRVRSPGQAISLGEAQCPASKEGGNKSTCAKCNLCSGQNTRAKSISIEAHGAFVRGAWQQAEGN